jgi:hypothetical protein
MGNGKLGGLQERAICGVNKGHGEKECQQRIQEASSLAGCKSSLGAGYWSSSEEVSLVAWYEDFNGGYQGDMYKSNTARVRAARSF